VEESALHRQCAPENMIRLPPSVWVPQGSTRESAARAWIMYDNYALVAPGHPKTVLSETHVQRLRLFCRGACACIYIITTRTKEKDWRV